LPFHATDYAADLSRPYVYATIEYNNAVAVINTNTATVVQTISLPGSPQGLAISPDGQSLYVTDFSNQSIDVINTQSLSLTRSVSIANKPYDVAVGLNNRLYVLDTNAFGQQQLQQIDALTGNAAGSDLNGATIHAGNLQISPDQNTLYYAQSGLSPSRMFAFDVTTTSPTLQRSVQTGFGGKGMVLTNDGAVAAHPNLTPTDVTLYRSSDFAPLSSFHVDGYPGEMSFSPNGALAYVSDTNSPPRMEIFNTATSASIANFNILDAADTVYVDPSGRNLFVSFNPLYDVATNTVIYDTGVPEPTTLLLAAIVSFTVILSRRSRCEASIFRAHFSAN
jgi:YVTN family beta-propeller protein